MAPSISVDFEEIDFSSKYEYFQIFDNNDEFVYQCYGTRDSNCGHWIQCLENYPLPIVTIGAGSTYNLTIRTNGFNSRCASSIHSYSANIALSITCSSGTATPTTPTIPTIKPTPKPTVKIYDWEQPITCGDTAFEERDFFDYYLVSNISNGSTVFVDTCYPENEVKFWIDIDSEINNNYARSRPPECSLEYVTQTTFDEIWIELWVDDILGNRVRSFKMTVLCYTYSPTLAPSISPSISPTYSPTATPTLPPTGSPTRFPTNAGLYDSHFEIEYKMSSIPRLYNDYMGANVGQFIIDMKQIIEREHATQNIKNHVQYREFQLNLLRINGTSISDLGRLWFTYGSNLVLMFEAEVECSLYICKQISSDINQTASNIDMSKAINDYFISHTASSNADSNVISPVSFTIFDVGAVISGQSNTILQGTPTWVWIVISLSFIFIVAGVMYKCYRDRKEIQAKTIMIKNAMTIPISIGFYDDDPIEPEIDGYLNDLEGVRVDINRALSLFGEESLNYEVYPKIYQSQNESNYKAYWRETELIQFLKKQANILEKNLEEHEEISQERYDGLIVIISCHGLGGYILTSDYKKINKSAIHRIFSAKKPLSRTIPRIFLFDCCSGSNERGYIRRTEYETDQAKNIDLKLEATKNTEVRDISREESVIWFQNEDNPDFKLVTINAANEGFQSKMRIDTGSYVVTEFISKLYENIYHNKNRQFLHEILDEVQEELHRKGKQLMVKTFNNKTEYIKFAMEILRK